MKQSDRKLFNLPRLWVTLIYGGVALVLVAMAVLYHRTHTEELRREMHDQLAAVCDARVRFYVQWRRDRANVARSLALSPLSVAAAERILRGPTPAERADYLRWMSLRCDYLGFSSIALVGNDGKVVAAAGMPQLPGNTVHAAQTAVVAGDVTFGDFVLEDGAVRLYMGIPLLREGRAVGALAVTYDPTSDLFPVIDGWPTGSPTAESVLVRRDGDDVLFLNHPRHAKGTAMRLRVPLTRSQVPAARAVLGHVGIADGPDYRGVPVLAVVRSIPDSPWHMVSKVDVAEVMRDAHRTTLIVSALVVALLAALAALLWALYRRQAAAQLQALYEGERERKAIVGHYDSLTWFANDSIFLIDSQGLIVDANQQSVKQYGYTLEELQGMPISALLHSSMLASFHEDWMRIRELGSVVFETIHCRKDGSGFPVEVSSRCFEVDGQMFHQSVVRDISERRGFETRLRAIFDAAPIAIISADLEGNITAWNRAAEEVFGWKAEEVLGRRSPTVAPGDDTRDQDKRRFQVLQEGGVLRYRVRRITKNGGTVTIDASLVGLRDALGRANGVLATAVDVTEQERVHEELRESRALIESVFRYSTDFVFAKDADGRYVLANPALWTLHGRDVIGLTDADLFDAADAAAIRERDMQVLRTGETMFYEQPLATKSIGRRVMLVTKWPLLGADGKPAAVCTITRDITEWRRTQDDRLHLEQELQQARKMESVGLLAGGVAHDFNNHLTVINGYCALLLDRMEPNHPDREALQAIRQAGDMAARLTRQLLAFSRKQILEPKRLHLNSVVGEVRPLLEKLAGESVEFVVSLDAALGVVLADPVQMQQILTNLVANARDAMPNGGRIVIETSNVNLDEGYTLRHPEVRPGPHVLLAVSDNGAGMDPETQRRIFEPFFSTKKPGSVSGTGLGLATVYGIVRQSGGWIWLYSEPGQGTTFKVYLPRLDGDPETPVAGRAAPPDAAGTETVLLVEDHDEVRALNQMALKSYGYRVIVAANGSEAIARSREFAGGIDILVTDVMMPGMTGREVANHLLQERPGMRVLFVSGYTANVIAHHGLLDAGLAYLAKPFTPESLAAKVREVLGRPLTK